MIKERYDLCEQRIKEIPDEICMDAKFQDYFTDLTEFLMQVLTSYRLHQSGAFLSWTTNEKKIENQRLYAGLLEEQYQSGYMNPSYAVKKLGKDYGQVLSALFAEMYSLIPYIFEDKQKEMVIRLEWFLQFYCLFLSEYETEQTIPKPEEVKEIYSSFATDYLEDFMEEKVSAQFDKDCEFAMNIVMKENLFDNGYLYRYGEWISDIEVRMADYLGGLKEQEIQRIADTFTEGFKNGFVATGKDISIKKTVAIRYFIGFERVVKKAVQNFKNMGLETILYRVEPSFLKGRALNRSGYGATLPNRQFESDHEYDKSLYVSTAYYARKLDAYRQALEEYKVQAGYFAGPAVIESFGELPFSPEKKKESLVLDAQQQEMLVSYMTKASRLLNEYVKGEERSFTIISFPIPCIGENFEQIFQDVIRLNTLDSFMYQQIQQKLIDALDQAETVRIRGFNGNKTDLTVTLWSLKNKEEETAFENCVADVNIPVGEVFTSPKLKGTNGILHVSKVFLNGLGFENLIITFRDGMITEYDCTNFEEQQKNKELIKENILYHHETLPMGEFAIGTNTTAYQMSRKYQIEKILPILIAEKTGPHFAVGDTCYSHEEDLITKNPDGKKIVARENEASMKRDKEGNRTYFGCHTDITVPYDELLELTAIKADHTQIPIIVKSRFALPGCEKLNLPFDE